MVDGLLHPEAAAYRYHRLEEGSQRTQLPGTDVAIVGVRLLLLEQRPLRF